MRGDKARVIREHEALVFQHDGGVFAREISPPMQTARAPRRRINSSHNRSCPAQALKNTGRSRCWQQPARIPAAVTGAPARRKHPVRRPEYAGPARRRAVFGRAINAEVTRRRRRRWRSCLREVPVQKAGTHGEQVSCPWLSMFDCVRCMKSNASSAASTEATRSSRVIRQQVPSMAAWPAEEARPCSASQIASCRRARCQREDLPCRAAGARLHTDTRRAAARGKAVRAW